jgi:hypothetical protein
MFAPLFSSDGKVNAVVQLMNKSGKEAVTDKDVSEFEYMSKMYGLLVERVNEKEAILHTIAGLRGSADLMAGMMSVNEAGDGSEGYSQIARMIKPMRTAYTLVSDMMTTKRAVMLEELSAATQRSRWRFRPSPRRSCRRSRSIRRASRPTARPRS